MEFLFEKKGNQSESVDQEESTLSSRLHLVSMNRRSSMLLSRLELGSKITGFFASKGSTTTDEASSDTVEQPPTDTKSDEKPAKKADDNGSNATTNASTTTTAATPSKSKLTTIQEPLKFRIDLLDYKDPSSEAQDSSKKRFVEICAFPSLTPILACVRLAHLDDHDRELVALSSAKNSLETFIYDIRDKLEHDARFKKASTSDEQSKILEKLTEIDAWLWDDGANADVKVRTTSP